MTPMPPNPWIPQSEADNSRALDAGAAPDLGRSSAAPAPIADSEATSSYAPDPAVATALRSAATAGTVDLEATDCINEIFWFVRNKLGDDRRAEDFVDLDALEQSIDPVPEFLTQRRA